jgi:hypothetical protein
MLLLRRFAPTGESLIDGGGAVLRCLPVERAKPLLLFARRQMGSGDRHALQYARIPGRATDF